MVGWHHWLDGHEFKQAPGFSDGQGILAWCSPWGHKESDLTDWLNWAELQAWQISCRFLKGLPTYSYFFFLFWFRSISRNKFHGDLIQSNLLLRRTCLTSMIIIMTGTVGIKRHLRTCPSTVHLENSSPFSIEGRTYTILGTIWWPNCWKFYWKWPEKIPKWPKSP